MKEALQRREMKCRDCKHFIRLEGIETLGLCPLESETLVVEAEGEPCTYFWPREEEKTASQIAEGGGVGF